jgi:acetylglutamate kinase
MEAGMTSRAVAVELQTIVVKIGGEVVGSGEAAVLAADLRELVETGARIAIVHGGGPQATELSSASARRRRSPVAASPMPRRST